MTPASPSWPSLRNEACTFIPIRTSSGLTWISWDVSRTPSSISMIAITYGFCISNWAGASWMTVYVTTLPFPPSWNRCILPSTFGRRRGRRPAAGNRPCRSCRTSCRSDCSGSGSRAKSGGWPRSIASLEQMDDRGGARPAEGVREAMASPDDLPLAGLPSELTNNLDGLGDAGRADRLAAGLQAARCVHGDLAVQRGEPLGGRGSALALFDEPQVLDREDLGDREIVM